MNYALSEDVYKQGREAIHSVKSLHGHVAALMVKSGTLAVLEDDSKALRSLAQESDSKVFLPRSYIHVGEMIPLTIFT
jgi:hypothetical protein